MSGSPRPAVNPDDPTISMSASERADWLLDSLRKSSSTVTTKRKFKPENIIRNVRNRELGKQSGCRVRRFFPSLIASKTRHLRLCTRSKCNGMVSIDEHFTARNGRRLDMTLPQLPEATILPSLKGLNGPERIRDLLSTSGVHPPVGVDNPRWIIGLTTKDRLCIWSDVSGDLLYQFIFRSRYDLRKLGWNRKGESFYVSGYALHLLDTDYVEVVDSYSRSSVLAVFELFPLRCKSMMTLTMKHFDEVQYLQLSDDMLFCYALSPHRIVVYDFQDILCKYSHCSLLPFAYSDGKRPVPTTLTVDGDCPKPLYTLVYRKPGAPLLHHLQVPDLDIAVIVSAASAISGTMNPAPTAWVPTLSVKGGGEGGRSRGSFASTKTRLNCRAMYSLCCKDGSGDVIFVQKNSLHRFTFRMETIHQKLLWSVVLVPDDEERRKYYKNGTAARDATTSTLKEGEGTGEHEEEENSQPVGPFRFATLVSMSFDDDFVLSLLISYRSGTGVERPFILCIDCDTGLLLRAFSVDDEGAGSVLRSDTRFFHKLEGDPRTVVSVYELMEDMNKAEKENKRVFKLYSDVAMDVNVPMTPLVPESLLRRIVMN